MPCLQNLEQMQIRSFFTSLPLLDVIFLFQTNSVSKAVYDDLVKKHQNYISGIKEQTSSVSQHLETTVKNAEESLR